MGSKAVMKIFILEDNIERVKSFRKMFHPEQLVFTDKVEYAKDILKKDTFDVLFLDHDLGGEIFVESNREDTGYELVKYIVENELQKKARICIHSHNPFGSEYMLKALEKANYTAFLKPFAVLYTEYKVDRLHKIYFKEKRKG